VFDAPEVSRDAMEQPWEELFIWEEEPSHRDNVTRAEKQDDIKENHGKK